MDGVVADGKGASEDILGALDLISGIESRRSAIREWRASKLSELEAECAGALRRLDLAAAALEGRKGRSAQAGQAQTPTSRSKRPRRRKRAPASATPAAAKERREGMFRYMIEAARPVAPREIQRDLGQTPNCVQSGLRRLMEEGRVSRLGGGNGTRYQVKVGMGAVERSRASHPVERSSVAGLILETIDARTYATPDELAQAVGRSTQVIETECGALLAEEELAMERRDGRAVYRRGRRQSA